MKRVRRILYSVDVACLCFGHRAFSFIFVGLEKSPLELHSPYLQWLAAYWGFPFKNASSHTQDLYHLYMVIFDGGSVKNSVQNLLCTVTTNFNPWYWNTLWLLKTLFRVAVLSPLMTRLAVTSGAIYYVLSNTGFALPWFLFLEIYYSNFVYIASVYITYSTSFRFYRHVCSVVIWIRSIYVISHNLLYLISAF